MAKPPRKTFADLARDMRCDRNLLDSFAVRLATTTPGDWQALSTALKDRGYDVSPDDLRKAMKDPQTPRTDIVKAWL